MRIDLSGHSFVFPAKCACCGGPADAELAVSAIKTTGKRVVHTKTNVWDVPYCINCVRHVKAVEAAKALAWVLGILSVVIGVFLGYAVNSGTGIIMGGLALLGTGMVYANRLSQARSQCGSTCVCVGRAVAYLGWHGTLHQFEVLSAPFARDFMTSNQGKLVNLSSEARNLLAEAGSVPKTNTPRTPRRYMS